MFVVDNPVNFYQCGLIFSMILNSSQLKYLYLNLRIIFRSLELDATYDKIRAKIVKTKTKQKHVLSVHLSLLSNSRWDSGLFCSDVKWLLLCYLLDFIS